MSRDPNSAHYDAGGIEALAVIEAKLTPEQYKGYLLGNLLKYSLRYNFKGSQDGDARKAAYYASWLEELPREVADD